MKLSSSEKNRLKSLYGPWALVTGASSGIGKELARQLASAGIDLVLTARRIEVLYRLSSEVKDVYGVKTVVVETDLSTEEGVQTLIESVGSVPIGLLVSTAGFGTSGYFYEADLQTELNMLQVNCAASLMLTHFFVRKFVAENRGGIILMGSLVGFQGTPFAAHYAATKAYIQTLAEGLSVELADKGVSVLSAAPGPVLSEFADRANMRMGAALKPEDIGVPILEALGRKQTVLPGFLTQFLVGSLRMLPRWGKVRVMKLVMGGMTKHQRKPMEG